MTTKLSVLAVALVTGACGVDLDSSSAGASQTFTSTAISIGPDGAVVMTTVPLSVEDNDAQLEARAIALEHPDAITLELSVDSACAATSLWAYDQANLAGNRICFAGSGTELLSSYLRSYCSGNTCFVGTWNQAVRSFWAGSDDGWWIQNGGFYDHFTSYQKTLIADGTASAASWIQLR